MLTKLSLSNFKSWRKIGDMRIAPITGLFGTNSSGKTSVLQLLLMLKQTTESADRHQPLELAAPPGLVDLGTFKDVIHNHLSNKAWDGVWTNLTRSWTRRGTPRRSCFKVRTSVSHARSIEIRRMEFG
jgi:translation initiation factor RLI1